MLNISILTATYNRAKFLPRLYESISRNLEDDISIEWLIMDDGSMDNTQEIVGKFKEYENLKIKYYFQENSGKMTAINNLTKRVKGELMIECDSDDYFSEGAIRNIKNAYFECEEKDELYAMCFLKYDQNGNNIGSNFKNEKTTMFDLYFKEGEDGEKALVYFSNIRKEYKYKLEKNEKFGTEARLHHKLDEKYKIKCINEPIMICEYQKDGYTNNIKKIFKENPYGYYEYFKEILKRDMSGVKLSKRLYVIKHYILFSYLTNQRIKIKNVKGKLNKTLIILLYIPGIIKSRYF